VLDCWESPFVDGRAAQVAVGEGVGEGVGLELEANFDDIKRRYDESA